MYESFELEWYGPDDNVYHARGRVLGPGYEDASWTLSVSVLEGPDGPLDWGNCTDTDQGDWPDWAHTYAVRAIDSMLESLAFSAFYP